MSMPTCVMVMLSSVGSRASNYPPRRRRTIPQDEARVGNKGRVCHRWWLKGERAPGLCERGYQWAYIFSTVRPATGDAFTLVLPSVSAAVMNLYLARFAATLADDVHAVMVLDGAGWHDPRALAVPDNITLVALPPYSPELNPVERLWLYLRERFLSLRALDDTEAIIDACCEAWNQLVAEPGRIKSLCDYPWIRKVAS
jgi:transposase